MKHVRSFLLLASLLGSLISCEPKDNIDVEGVIGYFKQVYAPDKRVARFDIQYQDGKLLGETNLPVALTELKDSLRTVGIDFQDSITLLPQASLGKRNYGVVTLSVANLRSQPRHSAELATQATLGTPVRVLKKENNWYLIQTPDRYLSWVDDAGIALMDKASIDQWYSSNKVVYTHLTGHVYEDQHEQGLVISDLTAGNIMELLEEGKNFSQIKLPDGREGFVSVADVMPYEEWIETRSTAPDNLVATARSMMGSPYLWGGTSVKGMDCSGFTKTIFFLNGQIIPRDASQQVREGEEVDHEKNWDQLKVGDLLFFGEPATENSDERVVHVGMWIGDRSFIHSRGRVRISSFDPESENFDEYELNRYLRTKRIAAEGNVNWSGDR